MMIDVDAFAARLHYEYCLEFGIDYRPLFTHQEHTRVWWSMVAGRILANDRGGALDASMLFRAWSHDLYVKPWNDQPQRVRDTWRRIARRMSYARERGIGKGMIDDTSHA